MSYLTNQASAARLLSEKGQAVTLTVRSAGAYDTTTGTATLTDTIVTTTGVVLPLSRGLRHMEGSTIQASDQQLLLPGGIDRPALNTRATIGGVDYTIIEVSPLSPGGTPVLYDCVIR